MTSSRSTSRSSGAHHLNSSGNDARDAAQQAARDAAQKVSHGTKTMHDFVEKFYHDWSFHLTQALTFGLVTSVIPLGMLLFAIVGQVIGTLNHHAQQQFIGQLKSVFPPQLLPSEITTSSIQKFSQGSGVWIIVSILAALFFGSRLFTLLEACFDIIYRVPPRPQKDKNLRAIVMVIVFMILTPLLVLTSLIPGQFVAFLQNTSVNAHMAVLNQLAGTVSSMIVSFVLFEIIYTFIPNHPSRSVKTRLRTSLRGSITATIVLQIALQIFPLYARSYTSGIVNQIAFALVFLIFFYIISLVTIIGATVNAYFAEDIPPTPHDLVTRSSQSY